MRSHIATREGTLTVTATRPPEHSATRFDPVVMLASDEGWHNFTCSLSPTDARHLADALLGRADEAEGK